MKRLFIALFIITGVINAESRPISPDEAQAVANRFFGHESVRKSMKTDTGSSIGAPYYVFGTQDDNGFVIVSGDDRVRQILGYSDSGSFNTGDIPPQLTEILENYSRMCVSMPQDSTHPSWLSSSTNSSDAGILLPTPQWGQGAPYNLMMPEIEGRKAPVGCTATAMAIAMKYHDWPPKTKGRMLADFNHPEAVFDYSDYEIDWESLDESGPDFPAEVSRLMLAASVAVNTIFGATESVAETWPVGHELTEKFSYSPDCQFVERAMFDDDLWHDMLLSQLRDDSPVIYFATGRQASGHAFVIDGVDSDGLYHVNWGWDGDMNGYFDLDALCPGSDEYDSSHAMIINIRPDRSGAEYARIFIPDAAVYTNDLLQWNGWNFTSADFLPGELIELITPYMSMPSDIATTFYVRLAIVNDRNEVKKLLGFANSSSNDGACARPGFQYHTYFTMPDEGLAPGERFQLVCKEATPGYSDPDIPAEWDNPDGYRILLGGICRPSHFGPVGNHSETSVINWHYDSSEYLLFEDERNLPMRPDQYTKCLKGYGCARNLYYPTCGRLDFRVECRDAAGNSVEPVISSSVCDYGLAFNISVFEDTYDVYIDYTPSGDTRHIPDGTPAAGVIEAGGLAYTVSGGEAALCGYTDRDIRTLVIPETILLGDKNIPVTSVADNALVDHNAETVCLGAGLSHISIYGMGWMKKLRDIVFPGKKFSSVSRKGLLAMCYNLNSQPENMYLPSGEVIPDIPWDIVIGNNWYDRAVNDTDIYLGDVCPGDIKTGHEDDLYPVLLYRTLCPQVDIYSTVEYRHHDVYIPGIGKFIDAVSDIGSRFSFHQMWEYRLDKSDDIVSVIPAVDNVTVDRVLINGEPVQPIDGHSYPADLSAEIDVTVESTVNGTRKFTTRYTPALNASLADRSGITAASDDTDASVMVRDGRILIAGLQPGTPVRIYNTAGAIVYSGTSHSIPLPPGFYIVTLPTRNLKIMI